MDAETKIKFAALSAVLVIALFGVGSFFIPHTSQKAQAPQVQTTSSQPLQFASLPKSFPSDFPLLAQSKITAVKDTQDEVSAVFLTSQPIDATQQYFEKAFAQSSWKITDESQAAGLTIFYLKKNTADAILTIGKGEQGTTISVTIPKT